MVQITVHNQFGDCEPPTLVLNNISEDLTVSSIKILIENHFKCVKDKYEDEREPNSKFVLFCGTKILEDTSFVKDYNTANLPELSFYLYEMKYLRVQIKVVKCRFSSRSLRHFLQTSSVAVFTSVPLYTKFFRGRSPLRCSTKSPF